MITNPKWWAAAGVRALWTMVEVVLAMVGTGGVGLLQIDLPALASAAAMAGVVSVLKSLAVGLPELEAKLEADAGAPVYRDNHEGEE